MTISPANGGNALTAVPPAATALAVTIAAIASQSAPASGWPSRTRPVSAANTGLTLMKKLKNLAGTCRSASTSATMGTAEHSTPAAAARPRAPNAAGWPASVQAPAGR